VLKGWRKVVKVEGPVAVPFIGLNYPKVISLLPVFIMVLVPHVAAVVADKTW
jgi:hypothetical protein